MNRRLLLGGGLVMAMLGFVVAVALLRAGRSIAPGPTTANASATKPMNAPMPRPVRSAEVDIPRPQPSVNSERQGAALHDATLLGLIQNAKVAQQKGDSATRDAMLAGMKKQPERSKELLKKELSTTQDHAVAAALRTLMEELQ